MNTEKQKIDEIVQRALHLLRQSKERDLTPEEHIDIANAGYFLLWSN